MYACACHRCTCVCIHVRLEVDMSLLNLFNSYLSRQSVWLNLEPMNLAVLVGQLALGVPDPILVSQRACSAFTWVLGIQTPIFTLCMANTLSTEPSPSPCNYSHTTCRTGLNDCYRSDVDKNLAITHLDTPCPQLCLHVHSGTLLQGSLEG